MTRIKIILISATVVALAAAWYFGSPRWTLWQMSQAAEARDSDRLAGYIDFPKLRKTTKAQVKAQIKAKAGQGDDSLGALGAVMGLVLVDPVVEAMITPETMRAAFANAPEKAQGSGRGAGEARGAGTGVDQAGGGETSVEAASGGESSGGGKKKGPLNIDPDDMKIVHKGPNEFRLRKKDAKGEAGDLIFRRHGLGWKLEEVRLDRALG